MKTRYAGGLSYLLVVICLLLLRVSMYTGIASGVSDTDLYFTLVCQLLCFGVAPACLWILLSRGNELAAIGTLPAYFNIKKCSLSNWLLTLAIAVPAVVITFLDNGVPYDPLKKEDPDVTLSAQERTAGGLGIFLVKKSMDDILYEYKDGQNILKIRKNF